MHEAPRQALLITSSTDNVEVINKICCNFVRSSYDRFNIYKECSFSDLCFDLKLYNTHFDFCVCIFAAKGVQKVRSYASQHFCLVMKFGCCI